MSSSTSRIPLSEYARLNAREPVDLRRFRDSLGLFASGITVIAGYDGEPLGFTCQSFYSVSVDPPLVSFSVMATSSSYPRIRETGKFSVNVLSKRQQAISNRFARKGSEKWAGVAWTTAATQSPVIDGALMWLDCEIRAEHAAGDHTIVIGEVLATGLNDGKDAEPLLYYRGSYRHLSKPDGSAA
ncbi:flavin reductase family protein [Aquibium oceanicum]|uniref:flavin reductase family protein n=1 Tax=Aquibium oceanicum TaxID=1670800 RepID=UPI001F2EFD03|nr:flavin reductase family protein [Aquibium oceanicum]